MKKIFLSALLITLSALFVFAQGTALIKFEKTSHNFGSFSESNPKVTCTFKFTNAGDGPLVIHILRPEGLVYQDSIQGSAAQ